MKYAARCGIHCDDCDYREKTNCPGCHEAKGEMFWGQCELAKCSMEKELDHCGQCEDFACDLLKSFAYHEEQGDDGQRIENLRVTRS